MCKLKKNEEALKVLNVCLKYNPKYVKALVKRGEVHQALGDAEEAVTDFGAASAIEPDGFGVKDKLKAA